MPGKGDGTVSLVSFPCLCSCISPCHLCRPSHLLFLERLWEALGVQELLVHIPQAGDRLQLFNNQYGTCIKQSEWCIMVCVCVGWGGDLEVPCRASCYPSSWCILGDGIVLGKGGERLRQQPSAQQSGVFQQWPFNMATPVSANISTALGPR